MLRRPFEPAVDSCRQRHFLILSPPHLEGVIRLDLDTRSACLKGATLRRFAQLGFPLDLHFGAGPLSPTNGLLNPHRKFHISRLLKLEARQPFQLIDQKRLAVLTPYKTRQYLCPAGVGFSFGQVLYPSP